MAQKINLATRVEVEDREQPLDATDYFRFKKVYEGEYIKMICHIAEVAGLDFGAPRDSIYRVTWYSKDRDNFHIVQEQFDYEELFVVGVRKPGKIGSSQEIKLPLDSIEGFFEVVEQLKQSSP